jgi:hypothetical protein
MIRASSCLLLLIASPAMAGRADRIISSASELRDWCRDESEASIIGRGQTPNNWTARYWDEGNVLNVKGNWRVGASQVTVECSIARGARAEYGSMKVQQAD